MARPIVHCFAVILSCALLCGCTRSPQGEKANSADPVVVRWSPPINGLCLGIELPRTPFVFEPVKGWTGPIIIEETDAAGQLTAVRSNAGGQWQDASLLKVHLKNTSTNLIFWSTDRDVWRVSFSAPNFTEPLPWPWSKPPPLRHGPIQLNPGDQAQMSFHMSGVFDIWPRVAPGKYTLKVSYSPNKLLRFARGGEGNWTHPYDVAGFWTGEITTPPITIEVKHPPTASSQRE